MKYKIGAMVFPVIQKQKIIKFIDTISSFDKWKSMNERAYMHIIYIWSDGTREISSVLDSSISRCESQNWYTLSHEHALDQIKSVNLSHNKAKLSSCFTCRPNKADERGYGTIITFCTFTNNTEEQYSFYLQSTYKHEIKNTNIIGNKGKETFYLQGEAKVIHSCILNNDDPFLTTGDEQSSLSLIECNIDNTNTTGFLIKNGTTKPFILALRFIETGNCNNLFVQFSTFQHCTFQNLLQFRLFLTQCFFLIQFLSKQ